MANRAAKPFKYRGQWRGQVTLDNGQRPSADFERYDDAKEWMSEQLANANSEHQPELGGPKQASLAQALAHYAGLNTITKGGYAAELDRINHYLVADGLSALKIVCKDGKRELIEKPAGKLPSAFEAHKENRLNQRVETYKQLSLLAKRSCSALCTADFRRLMVCMKSEGLSDSTIQKEIALLKHLFNTAAKEWNWKGFENPCVGLKLGGSKQRFVFLTSTQQLALREALSECDNPYFWPLVEICIGTTLRKGSLLQMTRSNVDLDGRVAVLPSKTGTVSIPLSLKVVQVLRDMPQHESGKYFPMSGNAVDMAWDGVRIKIGMPDLQFKDLRHVGATALARAGANSHQLQKVLGHKSSRQAEIYVNLVGADTLEFLDRIAPGQTVYQVPAPSTGSAEDILKRNRTRRLSDALIARIKTAQSDGPESEPSAAAQEAQEAVASDATAVFLARHADAFEAAQEQTHNDQARIEAQQLQSASTKERDDAREASAEGLTQGSDSACEPEGAAHEQERATGTHGLGANKSGTPNNVIRFDFRRKT